MTQEQVLSLRKRIQRAYRHTSGGRICLQFVGRKGFVNPVEASVTPHGTVTLSLNMDDFPELYQFIHWEDDFPNDPDLKAQAPTQEGKEKV